MHYVAYITPSTSDFGANKNENQLPRKGMEYGLIGGSRFSSSLWDWSEEEMAVMTYVKGNDSTNDSINVTPQC